MPAAATGIRPPPSDRRQTPFDRYNARRVDAGDPRRLNHQGDLPHV
jgi:hypothetical protein